MIVYSYSCSKNHVFKLEVDIQITPEPNNMNFYWHIIVIINEKIVYNQSAGEVYLFSVIADAFKELQQQSHYDLKRENILHSHFCMYYQNDHLKDKVMDLLEDENFDIDFITMILNDFI